MRCPFDDLNFIECFGKDGCKPYIGKMNYKQIELYEAMVIKPPNLVTSPGNDVSTLKECTFPLRPHLYLLATNAKTPLYYAVIPPLIKGLNG